MEFVKEITAKLENKPGRLAKICSALAHEKVNIQALTVMTGEGPSVLRIVTEQVDLTGKVLTSLGTEHSVSDAIAVEMDNKPGAFAKLLEKLAAEHINIEYAYLAGARHGRSMAVLHTSNMKRAHQVLSEHHASSGNGDSHERRPLHSR